MYTWKFLSIKCTNENFYLKCTNEKRLQVFSPYLKYGLHNRANKFQIENKFWKKNYAYGRLEDGQTVGLR